MADNKWSQPDSPPPPLFTGEKERNLVKQINDEVIERVIGQTVLYYPISLDKTNFHPLYGESIEKTRVSQISSIFSIFFLFSVDALVLIFISLNLSRQYSRISKNCG